MKSKFIILIFLFFILISFCLSSFVSAFSVDHEGTTCDFGDIDSNLYKYSIVYYYNYSFAQYPFLRLYSCDQYPIVFSDDSIRFVGNVRVYTYNLKNGSVYDHYNGYQDPNSSSFSNWTNPHKYNVQPVVWSNFDIKDKNNVVLIPATNPTFENPYIVNKSEIESGKFDKLVINSGDYKLSTDEIYLLTYYYSENTDNPMDSLYPRKEILLKYNCDYYVGANNEKFTYEVPLSHLGIDLKEGNKYGFKLAILDNDGSYKYLDNITFTIRCYYSRRKRTS